MPLLGQHSENSGGTQGLEAALQRLRALAKNGDKQAFATMLTIAQGGTTTGSSVPGWNGDTNWGEADTGHGNTGGRAADRALAAAYLVGDMVTAGAIVRNSISTHKDWTGGDLAKYAPAVLALIPGIGVPAALAGGAAMGIGESLLGLTNTSFLGAAAGGAAAAGGGMAVKSAVSDLVGPKALPSIGSGLAGNPLPDAQGNLPDLAEGVGTPGANALPFIGSGLAGNPLPDAQGNLPDVAGGVGTPGANALTTLGNEATPATHQSLLDKIGGYIGSHPATVVQGGLAALGEVQDAQQQGAADDARKKALDTGLANTDVSLGDQYIDTSNPYTKKRGAVNPAQTSARRALSGY